MTAWEFRTPGTGQCHYVARLINLFAQLMPSLWVPVPPCGGSREGKSSPLLGSPVTPWSICSTPFSSEIRLRPHRGVLRISASVKPHRFSWSQSSEAWTPTMTSCKQLAMKVLIFFLLIKISDMLFLKACISNQHNQPLIWLIWVPLVPTVPHRHTAPVLGKSSKLSVASAALPSFKTKLFREDFTAFSAENDILKAPTQTSQLKPWRHKGTFTSLWMNCKHQQHTLPIRKDCQHFDFFTQVQALLPQFKPSAHRKGYLPRNENSCYFSTASISPGTRQQKYPLWRSVM